VPPKKKKNVFRIVHSVLASEFSTVYYLDSQKEKAKFNVPLRRYLNTQSFYSVDAFFCAKLMHNTVYNLFIIFLL
jgi:hypothetical protein